MSNPEESMKVDSQKLEQLINKIDDLPTLPSVVDEINTLLRNPRTSAEEVGQAIIIDQTITSKVIRLVNSAFYGFPGRINTITHAIVILGFNTIRNIVLTASIISAFKKNVRNDEFDLTEFWRHSITTGAIAQTIGRQRKWENLEELFISGLIHDLGKLVLFLYLPDEFDNVLHLAKKENILFKDAERKLLGTDHSELGVLLADHWKLPAYLKDSMRYHHYPLSSPNPETNSAVHIADILSQGLGKGESGNPSIPAIDPKVWNLLEFNRNRLDEVFTDSWSDIEKAEIFLKIL